MAPTKPKPPPDDPAQSERFVVTAKEVEAESAVEFARAFKKIAPKSKPKKRLKKP